MSLRDKNSFFNPIQHQTITSPEYCSLQLAILPQSIRDKPLCHQNSSQTFLSLPLRIVFLLQASPPDLPFFPCIPVHIWSPRCCPLRMVPPVRSPLPCLPLLHVSSALYAQSSVSDLLQGSSSNPFSVVCLFCCVILVWFGWCIFTSECISLHMLPFFECICM